MLRVTTFLLGATFAVAQAATAPAAPEPVAYDPLRVDPLRVDPLRVDPLRADPLRVEQTDLAPPLRLTVEDAARNRSVPILIHLPLATEKAPVVLFSHGLGGTRDTCAYLGRHWAARGYVVVFVQHPGSDDSVWKDAPARERMAAMKAAASGKNLLLRCQDVKVVLDQLTVWNGEATHAAAGRLDLEHIGMSGHSFGAVTTQAVSGQSVPVFAQRLTDARIDAAIAFSPSSPTRGKPEAAFANVSVPWLLMTGTKDTSVIRDTDVASRLAVYANLPVTIDRYEIVLHDAQHSAFTERALPGEDAQRNANHHRVILALSTAFWDVQLRNDAEARAWLHGDGAKSVLEELDRWQLAERQSPLK